MMVVVMMWLMLRVVGIERIISAMRVRFIPVCMMVTVIMRVMFTMFVLMAVMPIAMMHMIRC